MSLHFAINKNIYKLIIKKRCILQDRWIFCKLLIGLNPIYFTYSPSCCILYNISISFNALFTLCTCRECMQNMNHVIEQHQGDNMACVKKKNRSHAHTQKDICLDPGFFALLRRPTNDRQQEANYSAWLSACRTIFTL